MLNFDIVIHIAFFKSIQIHLIIFSSDMSIIIPPELNPLKFLFSVYHISRKDQCLQDLVKKSENSKIRILFIVWSQCVHLCLNSYTKKLRMLKIE